MVGAIFRLRLSRRAQCEKNVETGDEHTMRMRFQSRKSDTSRNKATNFPRKHSTVAATDFWSVVSDSA
jgi:hypothetical protein